MSYTLLKMTQLILSSMDSDEINSISDTVEAQQVVDIIETTFNDIVSTIDFPRNNDLFELTAVGDTDTPTLIRIPTAVNKIEWLQYNVQETGETARNMRTLLPLSRYDFMQRMNTLDTAESNIFQFDFLVGTETFDVRGYNDKWPQYFTTFDNDYLLFDSYNVDEESTVTGGRSMGFGELQPTFTRSDTFTPDLDEKHNTILFNEAKSSCWIELKQAQNQKAEQRARRGWVHASRYKSRVEEAPAVQVLAPDYGRKGRGRTNGLNLPPKALRG
jgi:hypothetical protein